MRQFQVIFIGILVAVVLLNLVYLQYAKLTALSSEVYQLRSQSAAAVQSLELDLETLHHQQQSLLKHLELLRAEVKDGTNNMSNSNPMTSNHVGIEMRKQQQQQLRRY
jgi:hypothetical protein